MSLSYRFFAALLFISAFLLFMVQPLASRIILPSLGGTPAVWTTSMLFFQALLLGGYIWAHIMIRYMPSWLPPVLQTIIAFTALVGINYQLPLQFDYAADNATRWQLKTLGVMVGLPYFALATNAPLYQAVYKSFRQNNAGKTPYALYSISNIGSFLALIAYPFLIEPFMPVAAQTSLWQWGYVSLCLVIGVSGMASLHHYYKGKQSPVALMPKTRLAMPHPRMMALWCLLAFIPSSLMLGVTAHVTTDVASIPLLWIIPLAFYLASFVMAFAEPPLWIAKNERVLHFYTFALIAITLAFAASGTHAFIWIQVILHYVTFLFAATLCHLRLSQLKPHADQLTLFYCIVSVGGCLGGVFNALIVHHIFAIPVEYMLTIILLVATFARYRADFDIKKISLSDAAFMVAVLAVFVTAINGDIDIIKTMSIFGLGVVLMCYWNKKFLFLICACALSLVYTHKALTDSGTLIHVSRNTFGTLILRDSNEGDTRMMVHGTTLHGVQSLPLVDYPHPTTYYHRNGPLGDVFRVLDNRDGEQRIAALGMGVGTIACYMKNGRAYNFYEINQAVIDMAMNPEYFTYLSSCAPDAEIILGDARLNIERQQDEFYDLVLVDTFSSDSIPVHLLTQEALDIYTAKIKDDGMVLFHVSNRYFDLTPVIAAMAIDKGYAYAYLRDNNPRQYDGYSPFTHSASHYVVVAKNPDSIADLRQPRHIWRVYDETRPLPAVWHDDYVNIFDALVF